MSAASVAPARAQKVTGDSGKRAVEVAMPRAFELELHKLLDNKLTIGDAIAVPAFTTFADASVEGKGVNAVRARVARVAMWACPRPHAPTPGSTGTTTPRTPPWRLHHIPACCRV